MPPDDDLLFIGHMLDMARTAQQLIADVDRLSFDRDVKLKLALVRALQVIGEAARRRGVCRMNSSSSMRPFHGGKLRRFATASCMITSLSITTSSGELRRRSFSR